VGGGGYIVSDNCTEGKRLPKCLKWNRGKKLKSADNVVAGFIPAFPLPGTSPATTNECSGEVYPRLVGLGVP